MKFNLVCVLVVASAGSSALADPLGLQSNGDLFTGSSWGAPFLFFSGAAFDAIAIEAVAPLSLKSEAFHSFSDASWGVSAESSVSALAEGNATTFLLFSTYFEGDPPTSPDTSSFEFAAFSGDTQIGTSTLATFDPDAVSGLNNGWSFAASNWAPSKDDIGAVHMPLPAAAWMATPVLGVLGMGRVFKRYRAA